MTWLKVGEHVMLASGVFKGSEAIIESLDAETGTVRVNVPILGRPTTHTYPLSNIDEHLAPFADESIVWSVANADFLGNDMRAEFPGADSIFRTMCWFSSNTYGFCSLFRQGGAHHLQVSSYNLTAPCRIPEQRSHRKNSVTVQEWVAFDVLIRKCDFWRLASDDGRRFLQKNRRSSWFLEGYADSRYHSVRRQSETADSPISDCCRFIAAVAGATCE